MSYSSTTGERMPAPQMVTAFFDTQSDAQVAIDRIIDAGVPRDEIKMVAGADTDAATTDGTRPERSFFESLGDFFMPDEDRHSYAEGLRRGGFLVSVPTTSENRERILAMLDDEGTVDMDEREESWRSEGWSGTETGYVAPVRSATVSGASATGSTYVDMNVGGVSAVSGRQANRGAIDTSTADLASNADRDGTIEVVEENLRVGKRDVSHGRVRVRSYVVEDAVSEDVNLRSERVEIERRVVDRPVASFDDAFKDQTIELEETAEEAVVSKEARVKEEIDLSRLSETRTETVSDTVRRTEVEIDDERTNKQAIGETLTTEERARRGL